jgi:hypothetical protein
LICHQDICRPGLFAGINCEESVSLTKGVLAGADTHIAGGRPLTLHPK